MSDPKTKRFVFLYETVWGVSVEDYGILDQWERLSDVEKDDNLRQLEDRLDRWADEMAALNLEGLTRDQVNHV